MTICLHCHLAQENGVREIGIEVSPSGPRIYADEMLQEMAATCEVSCERDVLMAIIRGQTDATDAIVGGLVLVDDLGQLMAFKMAFKLERPAFDAYLETELSPK
mmetsp:Transcript_47892/g.95623  ORF Transcript_47892/g.95623 Transcript_47892/m.95623 type:complete len:104 (-) Transcript_47892:455-766(-)